MFHCDLSCRLLPDDVFRDLPREAVGNEAEVTGIDRPVLNAELEYRATACKQIFLEIQTIKLVKILLLIYCWERLPTFFHCQCPRALAEYQ